MLPAQSIPTISSTGEWNRSSGRRIWAIDDASRTAATSSRNARRIVNVRPASPNKNGRCRVLHPQVVGLGDKIIDVGGERRVRELSVTRPEAREIEAKHCEAVPRERAGDTRGSKCVLRTREQCANKTVAMGDLLAGRTDLPEGHPATRRTRASRSVRPSGLAARQSRPSGKNSDSSRLALAFESEP